MVASNRDEFLARPTTEASWHDWTAPTSANAASSAEKRVLSGLDLTAGGTWFGVSLPPPGENGKDSTRRPGLRFATLTNFTESIPPAARPSRGKLVRDFLDLDLKPPLETSAADHAAAQDALEEYLVAVEAVKQDYAGFNLLVGEISSPSPSSSSKSSAASSTPSSSSPVRLAYISNRESSTKRARILDPETSAREGKSVRGLSNSTLEVEVGEREWPKVKSGALAVEQVLERVKKMGGDGEAVEKSLAEGLYDALRYISSFPSFIDSVFTVIFHAAPLILRPSSIEPIFATPFSSALSASTLLLPSQPSLLLFHPPQTSPLTRSPPTDPRILLCSLKRLSPDLAKEKTGFTGTGRGCRRCCSQGGTGTSF